VRILLDACVWGGARTVLAAAGHDVGGVPHSGIIRLVGIPARRQGEYCLRAIKRYSTELADGALLTLDRRRVRIRK